jgi:hypothetical protein
MIFLTSGYTRFVVPHRFFCAHFWGKANPPPPLRFARYALTRLVSTSSTFNSTAATVYHLPFRATFAIPPSDSSIPFAEHKMGRNGVLTWFHQVSQVNGRT